MRLTHRFLLAIRGALFVFAILAVCGCEYIQNRTAGGTDSLAVVDSSLTVAIDSLDRMIPAPLDSAPAGNEQTAPATEQTAPLTPAVSDSQTVSVPAPLLDSLLHEIAALKAAVQPDTAGAATDPGLQDQLTNAVGGIQNLGRNILLSVFTLLMFFYVIRSISWTLQRFSEQSATRRLFFKRLVPIVRILMWTLAIYIILIHVFALEERQLISAWTAIGLAVGFASQDILKNIFGGIIIIIDQPFQVGDKINIGGTYGEVTAIGLRSTRIVTPDDNLVSVPNAQVVESQVANANAGALDCQVVIDLYLPGWVDVIKAKNIAYNAAANSNYVYLEKPIVVNVKDVFKETFLTHLAVKAYVIDNRYEFAFASDVTETAKAEFQRNNMLIPLTNMLTMGQQESGNGSADMEVES